MNKKAQIGQLQPLIISLVAVGIVLAIGFLILAEVSDQITVDTEGYNATLTTIEAMADIPPWLPIIVITVIGALLIGLVAYFRSRT